jgi:hypothetical protein
MNESEIKAKIERNNKIVTPFAIIGVVSAFAIPVGQVTGLFPFWVAIAVMIPALIIAAILGSQTVKLQEQLEGVTGVTAEKERVKEERHDKFLHGLDANNAITDPKPALSDAELMAEIRRLSPRIKKFSILSKILLIIGIIGFFPLNIIFPVLGFVPFIPYVIFMLKVIIYKSQLKCMVGNSIVRGVLSETFELTNYSPGCHIAAEAIEDTKLIPSWNRLNGSDLIEGKYRGVRFSFSDLLLRHESGSGKNRKAKTRFKGQWLIIELAKEIPHAVLLREDSGKEKSDIETENIEFNRKFQIKTEDPHTAFYLLTPHFMEYILQTKKRANAKMHMNFGGNRVHIALHSGRDLFEPCSKKLHDMKNIEMLRNQMQWDAKYITNIIDELLLNEGLFNAEK